MPRTRIVYFRDDHLGSPVRRWLMELRLRDHRGLQRCFSQLECLEELGYEARRPLAENLGNGIHELRIRHGRVHYRILYAFGEHREIVLLHALQKERVVPFMDLRRARERRDAYLKDPDGHGFEEETDE